MNEFKEEDLKTEKILDIEGDQYIIEEEKDKSYFPNQLNNGKITLNKPKTLIRTPNRNTFNRNIGFGSKGFTKMAGLALILAVFAIIIIMIINRV